jgi:hypothetical protein
MPDPDASLAMHQLALQEGIRSLESQTIEVSQIRDRVVSLISLVTAASAFLVGAALEAKTRGMRFYVPLGMGTAVYMVLVWQGWHILRPLKAWNAKVSAPVMIDDFSDGRDGFRALASFYENAQDENEKQLTRLRALMRLALLTSGALMICWILLVWLVAS